MHIQQEENIIIVQALFLIVHRRSPKQSSTKLSNNIFISCPKSSFNEICFSYLQSTATQENGKHWIGWICWKGSSLRQCSFYVHWHKRLASNKTRPGPPSWPLHSEWSSFMGRCDSIWHPRVAGFPQRSYCHQWRECHRYAWPKDIPWGYLV